MKISRNSEGRYYGKKVCAFFHDKSSEKTDQVLVDIKRQNATGLCTSSLDY